MLKPIITLKDIAVSFDGEQVLKNFNLTIGDGEFVTLLGPLRLRQNHGFAHHRRLRHTG